MYAFGVSPLILPYMRTYFTHVSLLVYNPDQNFLPSAEIFNYTFLDRSKERVSEPKKKQKQNEPLRQKVNIRKLLLHTNAHVT